MEIPCAAIHSPPAGIGTAAWASLPASVALRHTAWPLSLWSRPHLATALPLLKCPGPPYPSFLLYACRSASHLPFPPHLIPPPRLAVNLPSLPSSFIPPLPLLSPSPRVSPVLPLLDDPVEQLAAAAQLHHDVHAVRVLVGPFDGHDVLVPRQVVHDRHLAAHVLHVLPRDELLLGDRLARVLLPSRLLGAQERGAELTLPELAAELVQVGQLLWQQTRRSTGEREGVGERREREEERGECHGCQSMSTYCRTIARVPSYREEY